MKKSIIYLISLLTILLGILYAPSDTFALDAPHDSKAAPVVPCAKCHYSGTASGTPPWVTTPPSGGDNTKFNILCNSCHNNATPPVPVGTNYNYMKTHSSFQTSTTYGTWNMECTVCHNSHWQRQARAYPTEGYLFTGATTTKTTTTTLTDSAKTWAPDAYKGYVLVPNTAYPTIYYKILGNTDKTITVGGSMITSLVGNAGAAYGVKYGKLMRDAVATPASGSKQVKFFNESGPGSFATSSVTINGVCQVCHTKTKYFKNDGTLDVGTASTHPTPAGVDCTTCHKHSEGFKSGGCNGCHGQSGSTGAPLVYPNDMVVPATGHALGGHAKHTETQGYGCNICHFGNTMPALDNELTMSFSGIASGGVYTGTTLSSPYKYNAVVGIGANQTCAVYCHSTVQADGGSGTPTYANATWTGTAACGSCHATTGMTTGSHTKHLAASTNCGNCHTNSTATAYNAVTHVDGLIDVASGGTYTKGGAPGNGYGGCTTIFHSTSLTSVATPTWGQTGTCASCHASAPATGSHTGHLAVSGVSCASCHSGAVLDSSGGTAHFDGDIDVTGGYPTNVVKHAVGTYTGSCSTTACHGSNSATWGANTTNDTCTKCHGTGTLTVTAANRYVVAPPVSTATTTGTLTGTGKVSDNVKVGAHQTHLQLFNGLTSSTLETMDTRCQNCHGTLPTLVTHANGTSAPAFQGLAITSNTGTMSPAPTYAGTTCNNTYCHNPAGSGGGTLALANAGTGTAPSWTNAAYIADGAPKTAANCVVCHKNPWDVGFTSTFTHGAMTTATDCSACHGHNGDIAGIAGRQHIDGIKYGAGNCDACHGYQASSWATATQRAVEGKGAHAKHVAHLVARWGGTLNPATDSFGSGLAWTNVCGHCHNGATHDTSEAIGGSGRQISMLSTYQFGPSLPTYSGVPATSSSVNPKSCSSVSCHFQGTPVWNTY